MGRRFSGNGGGASLRAQILSRNVSTSAGLLTTVSAYGLLTPVIFTKTGGNANLAIAGSTGAITAIAGIPAGTTQSLVGTVAGADGVVIPFTANLTGQVSVPAAPTVTLTTGDGQISIAWNDNANGGASISQHRIYVNGVGMLPISSASPYVLTGLANDVAVNIELSAINSAGEGPKSAFQSATPTITAASLISAPVLLGPLTDGSTITITPGVWSSGSATRVLERDGVAILGHTGLTYTYNATTDEGRSLQLVETNNGVIARSNVLIGLAPAAAAITLNPSDNSANIGLTNGNLTVAKVAGGGDQSVRATAAAAGKVGYRYTVANANNTVVGVGPSGMPTAMWVGGVAGSVGYASSGPIYGAGGLISSGTAWAAGDVIDVMIDTAARKVWFGRNGVWQNGDPATGSGGANVPGTADIRAAWSSNGTFGTGTFSFATSATVSGFTPYDATTAPIRVLTATVNPGASPTVTVGGSTNGPPTQLQVAAVSPSGQLLLNWTDVGGLSGSTFSFTSPGLLPAAQGQSVTLLVRDKNSPRSAASRAVAVGYYAGIFPTVIGLNEGYWASDFGGADPYTDYGDFGGWWSPTSPEVGGYTPSSCRNPNTNLPISTYGADAYVEWAIGNGFDNSPLTPGAYNITYPAGMTAVAGSMFNASVTTPFSGGTGVVTVTGTGGATIRIRLSGTFPANGARISMKRQGEASTNRFSAQIATDYTEAGFKIIRYMTPAGTNGRVRFTPTAASLQYNTTLIGSPGAVLEHYVQFCNATNTHLHLNIHHEADDSWVAAAANYLNANLNPVLKTFIEWSNEPWNGIFPVHDWHRMTGTALGFWNTNGNAAPMTIVPGAFDGLTGITTVAYTSGTRIFGNLHGTGRQVWQAVGDQPIGSVVPATSNANWTVIVTDGQTATAGRRYQADRSIEIYAIFDTAFGATARSRTVRVIGCQAGADNNATFAERLLWRNLYQKLDRVATAPYWGGTLGSYSSSHLPGWGATEKALYSTNVPAWLNALFSVVNADIDATVATAATMKQNLEGMLRQAPYNLPADTIRLMSYECNHHITMESYPDNALACTAFNALRNDARMGTATTRYLNAIKAQLGGEHIIFDSVMAPLGTTGNVFAWGIMYKQGDRTNPMYNAIKNWIAANPCSLTNHCPRAGIR